MSGNKAHAPRVLIAGGGTGGHVFPALAIKQAIVRAVPQCQVIFVGTRHGLEASVLPTRGEMLRTLWISGFSRRSPLKNVLLPLKLVVSFLQSLWLLVTFRPQIVIGTGGYAMGPVLWIAQRMGIPTLLQEQNSRPGYTTRKLARKARVVCAGFADARNHLPGTRVEITGNPLRSEFAVIERVDAQRRWRLDNQRSTVLVFGGSAGARLINETLAAVLPTLLDFCNIIWQTGKLGIPTAADRMVIERGTQERHLIVREFIEDMPGAYVASDLAVCRAGAMTLAELAMSGLPAVLVPYPFATDDHQTANAQTVAESGAAVLIADRDLSEPRLAETIRSCLKSETRSAMAAAMKTLAQPKAADTIAEIALTLIRRS